MANSCSLVDSVLGCVCVCDRSVPCACRSQAAELGEFTAKIALLEEAKRKKEEEATEWQHKVTVTSSTSL